MKLGIISGSHRPQSESLKVSQFIKSLVQKELKGVEAEIISLSGNPLPLWDEGVWAGDSKWKSVWDPYSKALSSCDGFFVVSPEWGGMVPPGLKNFFLLCGAQELSHKPAVIVAVSAGTGGAYPVAELRQSSYKNNQLCYLPEHIIIRKVKEMLNDPLKAASGDDEYIRKRLIYSLRLLAEYSRALKSVRESGVPNYKDYPYGM